MHMSNVEPLTPEELMALLPRLQASIELASRYARLEKPMRLLFEAQHISPGARQTERAAAFKATGKAPGRRRGRATRQQSERLRKRILERLASAKTGAQLGELAQALGASSEATAYSLRVLRTEKKVRMTGQRASAKWHLAG